MKQNSIIYFGTIFEGSGHRSEVVRGGFDNYKEQCEWEKFFDRIEYVQGIVEFISKSSNRFGTFHFDDGTMSLYLLSPDDNRVGCKTILFAYGVNYSEREMVDIIKKDKFLFDKFSSVCEKYKLPNIFSEI